MMDKYKRILDSVHGYITIPEDYCDSIVDTPYFQRLRRIEQTSARTLFPSARHDRFIHSLGVYHLGNMLCDSLKARNEGNKYGYPAHCEMVFESYRLACLMHDIGHSPFSHTFEEFFDNGDEYLHNKLLEEITEDCFAEDWKKTKKDTKPHEIMSAYVALKVFRKFITLRKADCNLIARMIVGCPYSDKQNHSFENAFVELLHSKVLDVDGLDYACRDVWASGYSTFSIDVERLLNAVHVMQDPDHGNLFCVAYSNKAINEIVSVLGVKSFQSAYVFSHHVVVYEQELLVRAMKSVAMFIEGKDNTDYSLYKERELALRHLCQVECMLESKSLGKEGHPFVMYYPSDDDFVRLMKFIPTDYYVQQWLSRSFDLRPLWKSVVECRVYFGKLLDDERFGKYLKSENCRQRIVEEFGFEDYKVWLCPSTPTDKLNKSSEITLLVKGKPYHFKDVFSEDHFQMSHKEENFAYYYVPKANMSGAVIDPMDIVEFIHTEYNKLNKAAEEQAHA